MSDTRILVVGAGPASASAALAAKLVEALGPGSMVVTAEEAEMYVLRPRGLEDIELLSASMWSPPAPAGRTYGPPRKGRKGKLRRW